MGPFNLFKKFKPFKPSERSAYRLPLENRALTLESQLY